MDQRSPRSVAACRSVMVIRRSAGHAAGSGMAGLLPVATGDGWRRRLVFLVLLAQRQELGRGGPVPGRGGQARLGLLRWREDLEYVLRPLARAEAGRRVQEQRLRLGGRRARARPRGPAAPGRRRGPPPP